MRSREDLVAFKIKLVEDEKYIQTKKCTKTYISKMYDVPVKERLQDDPEKDMCLAFAKFRSLFVK